METYCVYMHKNKLNGKLYIGMSSNVERRWRNSGIEYKPKVENTRPFWNAIEKYGWDNFDHVIISDNLTKIEAENEEIRLISSLNTQDRRYGYNVAFGGEGGKIYIEHPRGMKGKKHTQLKKDKQRELMKRLHREGKVGNAWENGHPRGMLGKTHSKEYKEKLSKMMSGSNNLHAKCVIATFPDGTIKKYGTKKEFMSSVGLSQRPTDRLLKTGEPYEIIFNNQHSNKLKHLIGLKIRFADNTEVTK